MKNLNARNFLQHLVHEKAHILQQHLAQSVFKLGNMEYKQITEIERTNKNARTVKSKFENLIIKINMIFVFCKFRAIFKIYLRPLAFSAPLQNAGNATDRVCSSSEVQKSRVFQGCFTIFSRAFPGFLEVQNENNIHNEL